MLTSSLIDITTREPILISMGTQRVPKFKTDEFSKITNRLKTEKQTAPR